MATRRKSAAKKPVMGRPKVAMDLVEVEKIYSIGCTNEEVAAWFGVSLLTIKKRLQEPAFSEAAERGRGNGRISIRRMQMRAAEQGNPALLIWLGKQMLGQKDDRLLPPATTEEKPTRVVYEWVDPSEKKQEAAMPKEIDNVPAGATLQ